MGVGGCLTHWLLSLSDSLRHRARRRRWPERRALGRRGEDLAHRYLRRAGMTIVARNYRLRSGEAEVDLVAWDGDELVFVEVKSRQTAEYGPPDRAIGEEKRRHLERAARFYALRADIPIDRVRFDVVTVVLTSPPEVQHLRNVMSSRSRHDSTIPTAGRSGAL